MSRKRSAHSGQQVPEEIPELHVTAEELARMHPLIRLAIEALNRDGVETLTHYDGQGNILSVRTKRRKSAARARTFHSLLNAVRRLIQLEQQRAAQHSPYDLDGTVHGADLAPAAAALQGAPARHHNPPDMNSISRLLFSYGYDESQFDRRDANNGQKST